MLFDYNIVVGVWFVWWDVMLWCEVRWTNLSMPFGRGVLERGNVLLIFDSLCKISVICISWCIPKACLTIPHTNFFFMILMLPMHFRNLGTLIHRVSLVWKYFLGKWIVNATNEHTPRIITTSNVLKPYQLVISDISKLLKCSIRSFFILINTCTELENHLNKENQSVF